MSHPLDPAALAELDLRAGLPALREALWKAAEQDQPVIEAVRLIASRDRVALAELLVGPRAVAHPRLLAASLAVIEILEAAIAPKSLYRRLGDLAGGSPLDVLEVAIARHPEAVWLVELSGRLEGRNAGALHLAALVDRPAFGAFCALYAKAGLRSGLVAAGQHSGRIEPVSSLAQVGAEVELRTLTQSLLCAEPPPPIVAWLAATWGPDLDAFIERLIPTLREPRAVRALARQAHLLPRSSPKLRALARSLG